MFPRIIPQQLRTAILITIGLLALASPGAALAQGVVLPLQGFLTDEVGAAMGYVVPAICLALVAAYALYDMTHARPPAIAEQALPEQ